MGAGVAAGVASGMTVSTAGLGFASVNQHCAEDYNGGKSAIEEELEDGPRQGIVLSRSDVALHKLLVYGGKLCVFVFSFGKGFDNTDSVQVFLHSENELVC